MGLVRNEVYAWVVLVTCVIVFMVVAASQLASVSPSIPVVMEIYKVSTATAGLMTSVWALARVFIAIPAGSIVTRFGSKITYVTGISLSVLGWLVKALAPNYSLILLGRFIMGFGAGIISVTVPVIISEWFPKNLIGTAMGIWSTAMPLGILWELPLIAWLTSNYGLQVTYLTFTVLSTLTLAPLLIVLRKDPPNPLIIRGGLEKPKLKNLISNQYFVTACISIFFGMGLWGAYSTYIVRWCMDKGLDYMTSSYIGTLFMLGCVISEVATGYVSDKVFSSRQKPIFITGTSLASILTIVFIFSNSLIEISLVTILAGIGVAPVTVAMFAIPVSTVRSRERGLAMGFTAIFIYMAYMLTFLIGQVYDAYGLPAACIVTTVLGFIATLIMSFYVRSSI